MSSLLKMRDDAAKPEICKESYFTEICASLLRPGKGQRGEAIKTKYMCGEGKYDPLGFRPLSVTPGLEKGKEVYYIIDGLQRYTAITKTYGMDVKIPCFVTRGLSDADQKHALYLINHNASIFSDKIKLWQNAVEGGRDEIRIRLTKMFNSYGIGIAGYDKDGKPTTRNRGISSTYLRQGDLIVQYVFGDNTRSPLAGGVDDYNTEWMAIDFALKMITSVWPDDKKRLDDIFFLGLAYFCAKNHSVWNNVQEAVEKCTKAFSSRTVEQYINAAINIMAVKNAIDSGSALKKGGRYSSIWHGPAGYLVFKRAYEKQFRHDKNKLYEGYTKSVGKKEAMFDQGKYTSIRKILYRF